MTEWRAAIDHWRCSLSANERLNYRVATRWNCHDLKFFVGRINFEQLGVQHALELNSIPTRFKLSREDVEMLIAAGQDGFEQMQRFVRFLAVSTEGL